MSHRFNVVFALVLLLAGCSKIVVEHVTPPVSSAKRSVASGVFYALPETVISVKADVQQTRYTKGKYAQFAGIFAPGHPLVCGTAAACKAKDSIWLKEAVLTSYGRPDASHVYLVKFTGGGTLDQELSLTWDEQGLPKTVSASVANRTTDVVLSGLKLAGGIFQRTGFGGRVYDHTTKKCRDSGSQDAWILPVINQALGGDAELIAANYCSMKLDATGAGKVGGSGTTLTGVKTKFRSFLRPGDKIRVTPAARTCSNDATKTCSYDRDCVGPGFCEDGGAQQVTVQSIASDTSITVSPAFSPPVPAGGTFVLVGEGPRERFDQSRDKDDLEDALQAYWSRVLPLLQGRDKLVGASNIYVQDAGAYLDRIDALIAKEMASLYVGSKEAKTVWEGRLEVAPTAATTTTLLKINPAKGICAVAALAPASKPIPSTIKLSTIDCGHPDAKAVEMKVAFHPAATSQLFNLVRSRTTTPSGGDRSFRYRIPAQVRVDVKDTTAILHPELIPRQKTASKETYGSAVLSVAQLGHVAELPAKRKSKGLSFELGFIEATGGLKSFKLSSTGGLDASILDSIGTTTTGILDARKAAREAEAAKTDELAQLQRRAAILKAQKEICDVLAAFNLPCEFEPENEGPDDGS